MIIEKKENETQFDYIIRLIKGKNEGIYDISSIELFEQGFNKKYCADEARKKWCGFKLLLPYLEDANYNPTTPTDFSKEESLIKEEQKEIIKIRDERNLLNEYLRKITRLERYEDIIRENVAKLNELKPLSSNPTPLTPIFDDKVGVIQLSDWHYALEIENAWNRYNVDIFRNRLETIKERVIQQLILNKIDKLYVLVQGDLISSSIHTVIRVKNQEDIINQITHTTEYLAELIDEFSKCANVEVVMVGGNHDRVTSKKDESLSQENYIRLAHWFLDERFKDNKNVTIQNNKYGYDIGSFEIFGLKVGVIHGHEDSFGGVVNNLSTFVRDTFDIIYTSHRHHTHYQDNQKCRVIANSSLCGTDDYSEHLRATAYAGQNFSIINKNKEVHLIPIITP